MKVQFGKDSWSQEYDCDWVRIDGKDVAKADEGVDAMACRVADGIEIAIALSKDMREGESAVRWVKRVIRERDEATSGHMMLTTGTKADEPKRSFSPCGGCSPEGTSNYQACEGCRFNPDRKPPKPVMARESCDV